MEDSKTASLLSALKLDKNPLDNQFMYIEELNNADGSFLLSFIIKHQIERNHCVILILCHNSVGHFHSLSQKLDYNLMGLIESGQVIIIDILNKIKNDNFLNAEDSLKNLYDDIEQTTKCKNSGVCIILESIGNLFLVDMKCVFNFLHYIRTIAFERQDSCAVCSFHNFPDCFEVNESSKSMRHFSDVILILKDLQTGQANDVTGHLLVKRKEKCMTQWASEFQYQLLERSFLIFPPGCRDFL